MRLQKRFRSIVALICKKQKCISFLFAKDRQLVLLEMSNRVSGIVLHTYLIYNGSKLFWIRFWTLYPVRCFRTFFPISNWDFRTFSMKLLCQFTSLQIWHDLWRKNYFFKWGKNGSFVSFIMKIMLFFSYDFFLVNLSNYNGIFWFGKWKSNKENAIDVFKCNLKKALIPLFTIF